ncbi:MAG: amidohydrolase family protein, partial [Lachnospiraceae bacterium]
MKYMIKHAPELVTCKGSAPKFGKEMSNIGLLADGAVVVEEGRITFVGTTDELEANYPDTTGFQVIDATGKAVLPGFVDSHTHFVFGGY